MTVLMVPAPDAQPWPTLGPQVCEWIERNLVHGPGDLRGQPVRLGPDIKGLIWSMYELYPQDHPQAGRRRFKRVAISVRKGVGKTELAAFIAAAELHPTAPVRCVGWDKAGHPIGGGVTDPYIPLVAYTEEQSDELAYAALRVILAEGPLRGDFDIGLERIVRADGSGKAVALATGPDSRDGARTTFQVMDETHRWDMPRLKTAHRTMLANIPKRKIADAWSLEVTTAPAPGGGSVAEDTMAYALAVQEGRAANAQLFFYHRQASESHDLETEDGRRAAVMEASGPAAVWSDIESILEQWRDPTADRPYLRRVWLNQLVQAAAAAFDVGAWDVLAQPNATVPDDALITLGFDGSRVHDATALVGTEIETGHQFLVAIWERPFGIADWSVPEDKVNEAIDVAFGRWNVWRLYADPPYWESWIAAWEGRYGKERVIRWPTYRGVIMARSIRAWWNAVVEADLTHDGSNVLRRHIGNAARRELNHRDEKGERYWLIQKELPDSPKKIDAAMAAILAWEARTDAVALGVKPAGPSIYESRGLLTF